ncbi:hypothetical protein AMS68_006214 [Peltaster fructicola]|uniref:Uncharacterized protein n=1 Tax=Peltaster fructicola TaxID=286661 RepID=A0A6H0Y110_9PEZI|nr:hypothetical protein AMS68_006214 [Peltaster fructicola]
MFPSVIVSCIARSSPFRHVWFTDGYIEFGLLACLISIYISSKIQTVLPAYLTTGILSFTTGIAISIRVLYVSNISNPLEIWPALGCMALFAVSFITVLIRRQDNKALHLHLCATLASIWFLAAANYRLSMGPGKHNGEMYGPRLSRFMLSNTAVALLHIICLACMQNGEAGEDSEEGSIRLPAADDHQQMWPHGSDSKSMV